MPVRNVELRMQGEVTQRSSQESDNIQNVACGENRSRVCAKYQDATFEKMHTG